MAISTKPLYVPAQLTTDKVLIGFFQSVVDRVERPRVAAVADIPGAASAAELKVNELLAAFRTAKILEE